MMTVVSVPINTKMLLATFAILITVCSSIPVIEDTPPPPISECPKDSYLINGTCVCNEEFCTEPKCDEGFLQIKSNGTDQPGKCCSDYSCNNCPEEEMVDGECQCPPETQMGRYGKCECIDPQKSFIDGECVCDKMKCQLPHLCDEEREVSIKHMDGCCVNNICISCPEDSYPVSYKDDEIEDKCSCFPCEEPVCEEHQYAFIIQKGTNFPGNCCDIHECHNITSGLSCEVDGLFYSEGETWKNAAEEACTCHQGISLCSNNGTNNEFKSCHISVGVVYEHNEKWVQDACTNCTCLDGEKTCIAHMCDVKETKADCPSMNKCKKICEHGFKIKQGCEICKCKLPERSNATKIKFEILENFLLERNLTEMDVIKILNESFEEQDKNLSVEALHQLEEIMLARNINFEDIINLLNKTEETTTFEGQCPGRTSNDYVYIGLIILLVFGGGLIIFWKKVTKWNFKKLISNYAPVTQTADMKEYQKNNAVTINNVTI